MKPIQVRVPQRLLKELEEQVNNGGYSNRSEIVREAIRMHLERK